MLKSELKIFWGLYDLYLFQNPPRADIDSSDESDVEEDIDQPSAHKTKHDLMMKGEGSRKGSFFKQAKKSYPMFPAPEERIKWDEYGEIIKYVSKTSFSFVAVGGINCVIICAQ